jgi:uncharacterized coiled-coil protein SlyX
MKQILCFLSMVLVFLFSAVAFGQDTTERLNALEDSVKNQAKTIEEQQKTIDALKEEIGKQNGQESQEKSEEESPLSAKVSGFFGGSFLSNPNISLVLDTFAFTSNLKNSELKNRGIPGFTTHGFEQRNGFNLREAEFFLFAPVDPYFNLYANLPIDDSGIHIEEAYAVTTSLPEGFQMKGGRFKSNFSRLDTQHPHAWDFFDIALPYRAFLGDEGLGGENGVQLTWLPSLPFYTQFGAEVLQGDNDLLFGSDARSGPHAFTLFAKGSFEPTDNSTVYFGPSVLFGRTKNTNTVPNTEFTGHSALYGMEAVWKWKPNRNEGVILQSEYLFLTQDGDLETGNSLERRQDGFYVQGLYQSGRWRFGARYDMLELFADTFKQASVQQDLGATPWRVTGAIELNLSEFTRIRLQYNHDVSGRDGRNNDQGILQFLFGIGAHAAHTF